MRKVIHTSMAINKNWTEIIATCEDGTVWRCHVIHTGGGTFTKWREFPAIPSKAAAALAPIAPLNHVLQD